MEPVESISRSATASPGRDERRGGLGARGYSREVITQAQRELCAVASLTVLHRPHELRAHIHAALNVGATRQQVAEVIFQQVTYGGMPVVVDALDVFKAVLEERGEWEG